MALQRVHCVEMGAYVKLLQDLTYRIERALERMVEQQEQTDAEQGEAPQEIPY